MFLFNIGTKSQAKILAKIPVILILTLFLQTACTNNLWRLVNRENELKVRDDFNAYLGREYLEMARDLANKYQWTDSDYFAKKGVKALNNAEIYPEVPEYWGLDASQMEEANASRTRLQFLLIPRVKQTLPIQLAHLTMLYDCWISKEKKPWELAGMSKCKIRFFKLVDEIEEYMDNLKPVEMVKEEEIKEELKFRKFDIRFDFDSYKFSSASDQDLIDILNYLKDLNGDYRILLVGRADRAGKELYNDRLARERALMTQEYLIKNGVPERVIEIRSAGEESSLIITKNNKQNKYNRRVNIYVLKGKDDLSTIPLPLIENKVYKEEIIESKSKRAIR